MNTSRNIKVLSVVFILLFIIVAAYLVYIVDMYGDYWAASPYNVRVSKNVSGIIPGNIYDINNVAMVYIAADGSTEYCENDETRLATAHIIGDGYGQTIGAQSIFAKYILGYDSDIMYQIKSLFSDEKRHGNDVKLTVDSELCRYASELLDGRAGAVIMMNYRTGEIIASTSAPSFDPYDIIKYVKGDIDLKEGVLLNRATMGKYTPGSVFKIVTATAALRNIPNIAAKELECEGNLAFRSDSGELINDFTDASDSDGNINDGYVFLADSNRESHGKTDFKGAFSASCNTLFAELTMDIGKRNMKKTAEELGFNSDFTFKEILAYSGIYSDPSTDFELAWSGAGQYKDIVTPIHMCLLVSGIANGGLIMEPRLLDSVISPDGQILVAGEPKEYLNAYSLEESLYLKECMRSVVEHGTGKKAAVDGYVVCGKTGTAEVSSNENIKPHAWFAGFIDDPQNPYSICVVVENGGSGGSIAAPIASALFERVIDRK